MGNLKVIGIIVFSVAFLSGCEEKYSTEWYVKNHNEMIEKYTECLLARHFDSQKCQNARDALKQEMDKSDVKAGYKKAQERLKQEIMNTPVPDLNNIK